MEAAEAAASVAAEAVPTAEAGKREGTTNLLGNVSYHTEAPPSAGWGLLLLLLLPTWMKVYVLGEEERRRRSRAKCFLSLRTSYAPPESGAEHLPPVEHTAGMHCYRMQSSTTTSTTNPLASSMYVPSTYIPPTTARAFLAAWLLALAAGTHLDAL